MGVSIYPVLERDVSGVDATTVDGKALARAVYANTASALTRLQEFVSVDAGDFLPEGVAPPAMKWYDAAEGLDAVRAALAETKDERVKADLAEVERVLMWAQEHEVRFHLAMDI